MDHEKARAYNKGRVFGPSDLDAIARALGVSVAQVQTWGDTILSGVHGWQARAGLAADGMIGPKTLERMLKGAASEGKAETPRVIPNFIHGAAAQFPGYRFGTDLSLWNDDIDPRGFNGVSFIILKATEETFTDPKFLSHRAALGGLVGTLLGNYHLPRMVLGRKGDWADLPVLDWVAQAKYAASVARSNPAPFGEWFDTEPDSIGNPDKKPRFFSALLKAYGGRRDKAAAWVGGWLDVFEQETGKECGFYFSPRIAKEGGAELRAVLGSRRRWVAAYPSSPALPKLDLLPEGWDDVWDIWQCRGSDNKETPKDEGGKCLGVGRGRKDCDQNVLNPKSPLAALFG